MRSLDQVIVDYLASEAASEHLELALTSDAELVSGGRVTLTLKATTSLTEKPLAGVHVSIRVVSTVRPPQILFRGVTAAGRGRQLRLRAPRHRDGKRGAHHRGVVAAREQRDQAAHQEEKVDRLMPGGERGIFPARSSQRTPGR